MAANDANIATIRKRHEVYPYLSVAPEVEVLRGTISGTYVDQVTSVTYSNVSGSYTDVLEDMEAEIFTSGGTSKGRVRVALGGATSTVVQIEEVSPGRVKIIAGDQIRVYRSWRLRSRLIEMSEAFKKDSRVTYTDQTDDYAPVAISGGGKAGFIDPATSVLTVSFSASTSYTVDPDSGGTLTYLWDVDDGTITVGTSSTASITATFPAGARWISLTVTDSSNSKTYTQYAPVWAHEETGANAPVRIANVQLSATMEEGWAANFDLVDEQGTDTIPNGALIYIWRDSLYGDTKVAYGSDVSDRSTVAFVGYVVRNVEGVDGEAVDEGQARSTFSALSPLAILARQVGFSQVLEYVTSSPQSWFEATDLSVKRMLDYLIRWGTTFMRTHDFVISSDVDDKDYSAFFIQENTPLGQLRELATDALDGELICTRAGRIWIQPDLLVSDSTTRNAAGTQLTIDYRDYISVQYDIEHRYQYNQIEMRAITPGTDVNTQQPVAVVAPGLAPVEGASQRTVYDRRIGTLADCKNRVGWIFARDNSIKDGLPVRSNILLKLWIGYDLFDFFDEWVVLNIGPSFLHGDAFSNTRCVIRAISVTYTNDGGGELTLTLQEETDGEPGVELPQAVSDVTNDPIPDPSIVPWLINPITIDPTPQVIAGIQPADPTYMFVVGVNRNSDDDEAWLGAIDWSTGLVDWTTVGTGITGTYCWSRGDPYNPYRKFISTSTGLWKIEDVRTPTPPVQVAMLADIFGSGATTWPAFFELSNNRRGYICIMAGSNANASPHIPTSGAYTTDYGTTWTQFDIAGGTPTFTETGGMYVRGLAISPYNNPNVSGQGWVYAARWALNYPSAGQNRLIVVRSTAWGGGTWSTVAEIPVGAHYSNNLYNLHIPYTRSGGVPNKNDSNQLLHFASYLDSLGRYGNFTAGGTINNNFQSTLASDGYQTAYNSLLPFNTLTRNGAYVYMITRYGTERNVVRSVNGGTDFNPADIRPDGALAVGTYANPAYFTSGINGWGTEGTLIHFSPGYDGADRIDPSYASTSSLATGTVTTAYSALGVSPVNGFLRVKRAVDSDWIYIETPAYLQKICYGEFQIIA